MTNQDNFKTYKVHVREYYTVRLSGSMPNEVQYPEGEPPEGYMPYLLNYYGNSGHEDNTYLYHSPYITYIGYGLNTFVLPFKLNGSEELSDFLLRPTQKNLKKVPAEMLVHFGIEMTKAGRVLEKTLSDVCLIQGLIEANNIAHILKNKGVPFKLVINEKFVFHNDSNLPPVIDYWGEIERVAPEYLAGWNRVKTHSIKEWEKVQLSTFQHLYL
jgi:hypothetical protein